MTSKDSSSRGGDAREIPSDINTSAVSLLRSRAAKIRDVLDPGRRPTDHELFAGFPFYLDSMQRDLIASCETWRHQPDCPAPVMIALQIMRDQQDLDSIIQAETVLHDHGWKTDRLLVYRACLADGVAQTELADKIDPGIGQAQVNFASLLRHAVAVGLRAGGVTSMDDALETGLDELNTLRIILGSWIKADAWFKDQPAIPSDADLDRVFLDAFGAFAPKDSQAPQPPSGLIVVPKLQESGSSARREIVKGWAGLHGVPMPSVQRGDIAAQTRAIVDRWPHAEEIAHLLMGDLASREHVQFENTMLVGPAGSGKSSFSRFLMETSGLKTELMPLAGVHDASAIGTSAQWATSRENTVLQLIRRAGHATVGMIWDEPEKAGTSGHNGNVLDGLLPMLEPDSARRYRDLALEVEVDLSLVSHFACANSTEGLPQPFKDRFRILRMPEPTWKHIGPLSKTIIEDLAKKRRLDPRWYAPLADDELELIQRAWPGGSLRQLQRIVRSIIDVREAQMGRA